MKRRPITDDDIAAFRAVTEGVRPLKQDRLSPNPRRPKPVPGQRLREHREVMASLLSDEYDAGEIETGDELMFLRPGISQSTWRKFRRGHYAIEAELDLHGRTVPEAREMLAAFLSAARARGQRSVRVIHGKGLGSAGKLPVLKGKVNSWLRQKDEVLGFCSAPRNDGGTGAVYVLLKRG